MNVVYDSFAGRYSDNPRALFEHRTKSGQGRGESHVWLCDPRHADTFPAGVTTVVHGGAEAVAALNEADLVISNTHIELDWCKKPGSIYLQTWHGTPLKRVHYDVLWAPEGRLEALNRDIARWDYLLSPNAASTPRLRKAFRYDGDVLEVGYPRNDVLTAPDASVVRAQVRQTLGIADDVTAVLYTPTWRDDEFYANNGSDVGIPLDVEAFVHELGPSYVLLPRLHYLVTHRAPRLERDGVIDVSRYPDVHELYLAADVMITDYSSTMFDFAITGKPLLFFAHDLESYRDSVRGFYFDLGPVAPGPILQTTQQVIAALKDLRAVSSEYHDRYQDFQRCFNDLEDGHAADRIQWLYDQGGPELRSSTLPRPSGASL